MSGHITQSHNTQCQNAQYHITQCYIIIITIIININWIITSVSYFLTHFSHNTPVSKSQKEKFLGTFEWVSIVLKIFGREIRKLIQMAQVVKLSFLFSKQIRIIGSFFVYYLLSIHRNFSEKLKLNIFSSWFSSYMECTKGFPIENLKFFGTAKLKKNCDYSHFRSKNPAFF